MPSFDASQRKHTSLFGSSTRVFGCEAIDFPIGWNGFQNYFQTCKHAGRAPARWKKLCDFKKGTTKIPWRVFSSCLDPWGCELTSAFIRSKNGYNTLSITVSFELSCVQEFMHITPSRWGKQNQHSCPKRGANKYASTQRWLQVLFGIQGVVAPALATNDVWFQYDAILGIAIARSRAIGNERNCLASRPPLQLLTGSKINMYR